MKVMKFGGSSVSDSIRIASMIEIVASTHRTHPVCAVFSAMKGVTDTLLFAAREAAVGDPGYCARLRDIEARSQETCRALCTGDLLDATESAVHALCVELGQLLHGVDLVRECTPRTLDLIAGFGERLSCTIIANAMVCRGLPARYVDARTLIRTDETHGNAMVDFIASYDLIRAQLVGRPDDEVQVVTGFIAATDTGVSTTLGRNGSDYTASIVGAGLDVGSIEIWTDVDGVYSADPRFVSGAFVLPEISYREAMELSYFGAKVIHPYTMIPAVERGIELRIRNTLNPDAPGTRITATSSNAQTITGIASIESVALVNVEGGGMVGLPGIAGRLFSRLARERINTIMISQASSEHSICFVVRDEVAERAAKALRDEFARELHQKQIERVALERRLEIVAVIGENMRGKPGISGRVFTAVGDIGLNILAIAQGSSEMNISFIVPQEDREKALNAVHHAFFPGGV